MNKLAVIDRSKATLVEIRTDSKNFPRLHKYSQERATHEMSKAILLVFQLRGKQITKEDLTQMSATLVKILQEDEYGIGTQNITFEEITRVFKKAALGQGVDLYGVNVSILYQAIVDYCENVEREANMQAM